MWLNQMCRQTPGWVHLLNQDPFLTCHPERTHHRPDHSLLRSISWLTRVPRWRCHPDCLCRWYLCKLLLKGRRLGLRRFCPPAICPPFLARWYRFCFFRCGGLGRYWIILMWQQTACSQATPRRRGVRCTLPLYPSRLFIRVSTRSCVRCGLALRRRVRLWSGSRAGLRLNLASLSTAISLLSSLLVVWLIWRPVGTLVLHPRPKVPLDLVLLGACNNPPHSNGFLNSAAARECMCENLPICLFDCFNGVLRPTTPPVVRSYIVDLPSFGKFSVKSGLRLSDLGCQNCEAGNSSHVFYISCKPNTLHFWMFNTLPNKRL